MFQRVCLFSLDFYALLYSGLDSAHIKCGIRREKTKKTPCFKVLCANRCFKRHYTKVKSRC